MTTSRTVTNPPLTLHLVGRGLLTPSPLVLADVGVSGGIDPCWSCFGEALRVWGFDPLEGEIALLAGENPRHTYVAAKVGCRCLPAGKGEAGSVTRRNNHCHKRLASTWAVEIIENFTLDRYDRSGQCRLSDRLIELDDYFPGEAGTVPNFLKIDTDGFDLDVLLGSRRLLDAPGLLGLSVESQFVGNIGPKANVFSNIDTLLRRHGFTLFDLDPARYARRSLPAPFMFKAPVHSSTGQLVWAEAVYFRDYGNPDYEKMWGIAPEKADILKLACLFELYGLADCAADLLLKYGGHFEDGFVETCLDILTPLLAGRPVSHAGYLAAFESYVRAGYDKSLFDAASPFLDVTKEEWQTMQGALRRQQEQLNAQEMIVSSLEERIRRLQDRETERLREELKKQGII